PNLVAVLVTGPFMPTRERTLLQARATPACRVVPEADTLELMAAADAILGMGGYNSVIEALAAARPLVIVPRATHKVEQQIRAETLAAQGLAQWVHPKDLNGDGGGGGSELAATVRKGTSRRYEWLGKFYDEDRDARRVASVLRQLAEVTASGARTGPAVPGVIAYHAPERLLLLTYEPGEPVASAIGHTTLPVVSAMGRALAALHAAPIVLEETVP